MEKDSKLKQAMKGLDSFLTTHYSFRYNQITMFQSQGGSLVMVAKGNRSQAVTDACKKHGGFYLGTIGGVAAVLSASSIKSIECVEWPELGMEAVYKIEVVDFPAFILVDDKGNDFFKQLKPRNEIKCECCKK